MISHSQLFLRSISSWSERPISSIEFNWRERKISVRLEAQKPEPVISTPTNESKLTFHLTQTLQANGISGYAFAKKGMRCMLLQCNWFFLLWRWQRLQGTGTIFPLNRNSGASQARFTSLCSLMSMSLRNINCPPLRITFLTRLSLMLPGETLKVTIWFTPRLKNPKIQGWFTWTWTD